MKLLKKMYSEAKVMISGSFLLIFRLKISYSIFFSGRYRRKNPRLPYFDQPPPPSSPDKKIFASLNLGLNQTETRRVIGTRDRPGERKPRD